MVESLEATRSFDWRILLPVLGIVAFALLGVFIEQVVLRFFRRVAEGSSWTIDDVLLEALRGMPTLWLTLAGIAIFLDNIAIEPRVLLVAGTVSTFLVIVSITIVLVRIATGYVRASAGSGNISSVSILNNLIRGILGFFGLIVILQYVGVSITPLLGIIAGSSVGLTLALQQPLTNLFAGVMLLASNKVRPGNYIRLNSGEEGYVTDIRWHTTFIRQLSNNMISIPNATMVSSIMTNYDEPEKEMSVLINIGVSYDSDLEHVERVTVEVADETVQEVTGGVYPEGGTFIRYNNLDDFSINFTVILRGQDFVSQYLLKHEFIKRLVRRYREEGIIIPYPIRTLHTYDDHPVRLTDTSSTNGRSRVDHLDAQPTASRVHAHEPANEA